MSRFIIAGFILLAMCLPVSVGAYGKTTVDPNASRTNTVEETIVNGDATQKVTYEAKRKTVLSILADLSKMTGVTLKAGYNNEDWQVRDRRMNIFVKDIPLSDLMNSIARVMKFKWSKSENDGVDSYRLYMDRKTLLGAERQRYIEEERLKKRQTEGRERLLTGLKEAAGMSEEELEGLKTKSPYIYAMTKMGWADALPKLYAEVPSIKQAWGAGAELTLDMKSLPPVVIESLANTFNKSDQYMSKGLNSDFTEDLKGLADGTISINDRQSQFSYNKNALSLGDVSINFPPSSQMQFRFVDPESEYGKFNGNFLNRESPLTASEKDKSDIEQCVAAMDQAEQAGTKDLGEPLLEHSDDPTLSKKVKMAINSIESADVLADFASISEYSIVSDSFDARLPWLSFPADEIQVRTVLDKLESTWRYNWERHGSTLELHDRDWFTKRSDQIPEAWLEAWRKSLKENGSLNIDELSQIAGLTAQQFRTNVFSDEVLGNIALRLSISESKDLLRVYSGLGKQQRSAVFAGQGLNIGLMNGNLLNILLTRCPSLQEQKLSELWLVASCKKCDEGVQYTFKITTSSGDAVGTQWKILSPKYLLPTEKLKSNSPGQKVEGAKH